MKVLGIDTIFHDSTAAVAETGRGVLSNIKDSSRVDTDRLLDLSMASLKKAGPVIREALRAAETNMKGINLIAVNNFGSLISSVEAGVAAANTLASVFDIPVIAVNHQEAHIFSCWVERNPADFRYPILVFSASGGHSSAALVEKDDFRSKTVSGIAGMDSKGLAPDFNGLGALYGFVAYNLGNKEKMGAGAVLSEWARGGDKKKYVFKALAGKQPGFDYRDLEKEIEALAKKNRGERGDLDRVFVSDLAASFEYSIANDVSGKLLEQAKNAGVKEMHVVGGISANDNFCTRVHLLCQKNGLRFRRPKSTEYSTDNAAMIASLGYRRYRLDPDRYRNQRSIGLVSNLKLEHMACEQYIKNELELDES